MSTQVDPNSSMMAIALFLRSSAEHLETLEEMGICYHRTYDDHKANQLLNAMADLFIAEAVIGAWFADLGFDGQCQAEDSSIGGIPCFSSSET